MAQVLLSVAELIVVVPMRLKSWLGGLPVRWAAKSCIQLL